VRLGEVENEAHVALAPSDAGSARAAAQTDSAGAPAAAAGGGSPGVSVGESKRTSSASPCALNRACRHAFNSQNMVMKSRVRHHHLIMRASRVSLVTGIQQTER
jgi:hypothetical protein